MDELNLSIEARSLTRASHDSLSARLSGQSISSSIGENPVSPPGHNKQPSAAASKQDFTSKLVLTPRGSIARAGDNSTMSFLAKSRAAAAASAAGAGAKADDEEEGVSMMQKTRKVSTRSAARAANSNGGSDDRVATTNAVSQQSSAERGVSVGAQGDQHGIRSSLHGMQSSLQGSSRDAMYKNSLNVDASRDLGSSRDLPPPVRPWQQLDSSPADKMSGGAHKTAYPNANTRAEVALPPGWEMKLDKPSGKIFYVNHSIRAISWDPPQHEPLDNKDRSPQKAHPTSSNSMYSKHPTNVAQQRDRQPSSRSVSAQYQPGISGVYASGTSPAPQLSASFDPNRGVRSARNSLGQNTNSDFLAGGLSPSRAPVLLDTTVKEAHVNSAPGRGNIKESPPRRAAARSAGAQSPMDACPVFGGDSAFSAGPNTGWNIGDSLDSSSRHYDAAPPYRPGMTPRQSVSVCVFVRVKLGCGVGGAWMCGNLF